MKNIDEYIHHLSKEPLERKALFEEIMIAVTSFFRDRDFYESLEAQLDRLESLKDGQIRVWVAGCSKGQEAYSLAILLMEYREKKELNFSIKIFATDLNSSNIEYASRGFYTKSEVETVSESLREKYFIKKDGLFLVREEIRECLIFSVHDLISSPPFSNMSLVSCRNLLIYLTPSSQAKAISNLVFSLKVGGILALGPSETLGALAPSMLVMDGKWRIFKKLKKFETYPMPKWEQPKSFRNLEIIKRNTKSSNRFGGSDFSLVILESLYPNALVINEQFEILAIFGEAHKLLNKTPRGVMTLSLEGQFDPKIQLPITSILLEAKQKKSKIRIQSVPLTEDGIEILVELVVQAILVPSGEFFYICEISPATDQKIETIKNAGDTSDIIASLQVELHECRNELNATIAVTEESNEELQTTNEELISSNEELQSTNEELNSVNEELYTLNTEFQEKISQLALINADLENLINALNIGVIYLDQNFLIRRVTAQPDVVLNVKMIDIGRSLFDLKTGEILRPIQDRVKKGEKIDHSIEYTPENGRFYLIRITNFLDHKTKDHGYIVTIVDISESKKNEIFLEETQKVAKMGGWIVELATMTPIWSRQVYAIHEVEYGSPIDLSLAINFFAPKERERMKSYVSACREGVPYEDTFEFITAKGRNIWVRATGRPVYGPHGDVTMLRGTLQDITEMRISDQQQALALDVTQTGVWTWDYLTGKLNWDKQMYLLYGKTPTTKELTFQDWRESVNPDDLSRFERDLMDSMERRTLFSGSFQIKLPNGDSRWIACSAKGLYDEHNKLFHVIGVNRDQTEELNFRKTIEEERTRNQQAMKMASIGELASGIGHEVNNPLAIMISNLEFLLENLSNDESSQQLVRKTLDAGSRI